MREKKQTSAWQKKPAWTDRNRLLGENSTFSLAMLLNVTAAIHQGATKMF